MSGRIIDRRDQVAPFISHLFEPRSPLIRQAVDLTRGSSLRFLPEGIEQADQLRRLVAMGATLGQGFHLARPMPEDEFFASLPSLRVGHS